MVPRVRACRWAATNRTMSSSQSVSVRRRRWAAPAARRARAIAPRCSAGGLGVPAAQLGVGGLHLVQLTGLRVGEGEHADVRQLQLARVDDLDGQHVVPHAELAQRAGPAVDRRQEVGDDHGHPAPARRPVEHVDQRAEVGAARAGSGCGRSPAAGPAPPCGRGGPAAGPPARGVRLGGPSPAAGAVAADRVPAGRTPEPVPTTAPIRLPPRTVRWAIAVAAATTRSRLSQLRGAEVEAGRQVDRQPGLQLPVGDRPADVRQRGAGGDRPVHPAHVVAGPVLPGLARLAARARQQAHVVALQQPVELAGDQQLQPREHRLGAARLVPVGRARVGLGSLLARPYRHRPGDAGRGRHAADRHRRWPAWPSGEAPWREATDGIGTLCMIRATMWSAGMSSASAS